MGAFSGHFAPLEIKSAEQEVYVALRDQIVRGLPPLAPRPPDHRWRLRPRRLSWPSSEPGWPCVVTPS